MKKVITAFALAFIAVLAFGQDASEVDALLERTEVSYGLAARFVLPAAGILPDKATEEDSFYFAREKGWIPASAESGNPIRLDSLAFLAQSAFGPKTGLLYTLFPGPRYAYREFVYRKYIQGRSDPAQKVPGDRVIRIIGRLLDASGEAL